MLRAKAEGLFQMFPRGDRGVIRFLGASVRLTDVIGCRWVTPSRHAIWLAAAVVLAVGCRAEPGRDHGDLLRLAVTAREVVSQSKAFAIPAGAAVVGEYLVVLDAASDSVIHVLSRTDGTVLVSYGRSGDGPGEFKTAWSVDAPSPDGFWVFDPTLSRMTYLDLEALLRDPEAVVPRILNLNVEGFLLGPIWMREGWMLSPGFFGDHRLAKLDESGVMVERVGPPPAGDPLIPPDLRSAIHQGIPTANPRHDRLVVASTYVPRIEIFDSHGTLLTTAQVPIEWDLRSEDLVSLEGLMVTEDMRSAYLAVTAANDWFFGLFSGNSSASGKSTELGEYVHVFDWTGRFVGYIGLEVEAVAISVDPEASILYVLEDDPLPTVSAYRLVGLDSGREE